MSPHAPWMWPRRFSLICGMFRSAMPEPPLVTSPFVSSPSLRIAGAPGGPLAGLTFAAKDHAARPPRAASPCRRELRARLTAHRVNTSPDLRSGLSSQYHALPSRMRRASSAWSKSMCRTRAISPSSCCVAASE
jgi:hypothetical protein